MREASRETLHQLSAVLVVEGGMAAAFVAMLEASDRINRRPIRLHDGGDVVGALEPAFDLEAAHAGVDAAAPIRS